MSSTFQEWLLSGTHSLAARAYLIYHCVYPFISVVNWSLFSGFPHTQQLKMLLIGESYSDVTVCVCVCLGGGDWFCAFAARRKWLAVLCVAIHHYGSTALEKADPHFRAKQSGVENERYILLWYCLAHTVKLTYWVCFLCPSRLLVNCCSSSYRSNTSEHGPIDCFRNMIKNVFF